MSRDIVVTLNGGGEEMDSATIPIGWWLSESILKKNPHYLLIVELDNWECGYDESIRGRRYACKVSDMFYFLQLFSPGRHRLAVAVVKGDEKGGKKIVEQYLHKKFGHYENSISFDEYDYPNGDFLAVAVVEFDVPEELFAKPPKTRIGKMMWRWVNLWFDEESKDQCVYKKRKLIAFTIQPPVVLIFSLLSSLYVLVASIIVFFFGFRPRPILSEIKDAFLLRKNDYEVRKYTKHGYKVWRRGLFKSRDVKIPVAPWEIAVIVSLIYVVYKFKLLDVSLAFISVVIILVAIWFVFFKFLPPKIEEVNFKRQEKKEKNRIEWLKKNLSLDNKKDKVDMADIVTLAKTSPSFGQKAVIVFRAGYWAVKSKVCKPYSR